MRVPQDTTDSSLTPLIFKQGYKRSRKIESKDSISVDCDGRSGSVDMESSSTQKELRRMLRDGYSCAQAAMAYLCELGFENAVQHYDVALGLYLIAADCEHDPIGEFGAGRLYYFKEATATVSKPELAREYLVRAADSGLPEACILVGYLAIYRWPGFDEDQSFGKKYLEVAREKDYPAATFLLAKLSLIQGQRFQALKLFCRAIRSQIALGRIDAKDPRLYNPIHRGLLETLRR